MVNGIKISSDRYLDRFSKRMPEMAGERGGFSGKETARRLLGQSLTSE